MLPSRLSEVVASEVHAVIDHEAAETVDFELKRALPAKKGTVDPWITHGTAQLCRALQAEGWMV